MGSLTNSGVLLRLPCANGDVARPPSPRLPRGHQEHEYRNSSLLPPLLGVQNPNEIAVCVLKAALMLYPSRAFVTRPLVVWHPGALASFPTPHLTPPVSGGQGPHRRPEHLAACKRPNPSAALSTSHGQLWQPILVTQKTRWPWDGWSRTLPPAWSPEPSDC